MAARIFSLPLLIALALSAAVEVPPLRGRINDLAGLMPSDHTRDLEERLKRFEEETGHQIAVLTIPSLEGEDIEGFSIRVAESWKIGQKGFDNGAILVIAPNDRKLRIEVGYGLEGVLPDALANRIIQTVIVPHFRNEDYAGGIEAGIDAILRTTRGEPLPESKQNKEGRAVLYQLLWILLILGIPISLLFGRLTQRRSFGSWTGREPRRHNDWGGFMGGGWGGGDFGGGGSGFSGGGGGFGGGGASGSW